MKSKVTGTDQTRTTKVMLYNIKKADIPLFLSCKGELKTIHIYRDKDIWHTSLRGFNKPDK